jgi:hypothetical protein
MPPAHGQKGVALGATPGVGGQTKQLLFHLFGSPRLRAPLKRGGPRLVKYPICTLYGVGKYTPYANESRQTQRIDDPVAPNRPPRTSFGHQVVP